MTEKQLHRPFSVLLLSLSICLSKNRPYIFIFQSDLNRRHGIMKIFYNHISIEKLKSNKYMMITIRKEFDRTQSVEKFLIRQYCVTMISNLPIRYQQNANELYLHQI